MLSTMTVMQATSREGGRLERSGRPVRGLPPGDVLLVISWLLWDSAGRLWNHYIVPNFFFPGRQRRACSHARKHQHSSYTEYPTDAKSGVAWSICPAHTVSRTSPSCLGYIMSSFYSSGKTEGGRPAVPPEYAQKKKNSISFAIGMFGTARFFPPQKK